MLFRHSFDSILQWLAGGTGTVAISLLQNHDPSHDRVFEPRNLMFYPADYMAARVYPKNAYIGSPDREEIKIGSLQWEQHDAFQVSFLLKLKSGARLPVTYVVVPDCGYNVVRISGGPKEADVDIWTTECKLKQLSPEVWFPSEVEYYRRHGDVVKEHESLHIKLNNLNEGIDPRLFTLSAMDLPENTPVYKEGD